MPLERERERRWFAYLLGEVDSEEGGRIEAEMRQAPEEAAEVKRLFESLSAWSKAPVPHSPFRIEDLALDSPEAAPPRAVSRFSFSRPLPWAVAALFLLAASQIAFSFTLGDATFAWGSPAPAATRQSIEPALSQRLEALEAYAAETNAFVETVAMQMLMLENKLETAAAELEYKQRAEAQARYRDVQRLYQLSSQGAFREAGWMETSNWPPTLTPAQLNQ